MEYFAEAVVDTDDDLEPVGHSGEEEQVGCKNGDQEEVFFTRHSEGGQGAFHQRHQLQVQGMLHLQDLYGVLQN